MGRGFLFGVLWGLVVSVVVVVVTAQLGTERALVLPEPETADVGVPVGTPFDRERADLQPVAPAEMAAPATDPVAAPVPAPAAGEAPPEAAAPLGARPDVAAPDSGALDAPAEIGAGPQAPSAEPPVAAAGDAGAGPRLPGRDGPPSAARDVVPPAALPRTQSGVAGMSAPEVGTDAPALAAPGADEPLRRGTGTLAAVTPDAASPAPGAVAAVPDPGAGPSLAAPTGAEGAAGGMPAPERGAPPMGGGALAAPVSPPGAIPSGRGSAPASELAAVPDPGQGPALAGGGAEDAQPGVTLSRGNDAPREGAPASLSPGSARSGTAIATAPPGAVAVPGVSAPAMAPVPPEAEGDAPRRPLVSDVVRAGPLPGEDGDADAAPGAEAPRGPLSSEVEEAAPSVGNRVTGDVAPGAEAPRAPLASEVEEAAPLPGDNGAAEDAPKVALPGPVASDLEGAAPVPGDRETPDAEPDPGAGVAIAEGDPAVGDPAKGPDGIAAAPAFGDPAPRDEDAAAVRIGGGGALSLAPSREGEGAAADVLGPESAGSVVTGRLPTVGDDIAGAETLIPRDEAREAPVEAAPAEEATPPAAQPALLRNAVPFDNDGSRPLLAVVLLDEGGATLDLPFPVSLAVDAAAPGATARAEAARAAGAEIVAIPALPAGGTASDVARSLGASLDLVPDAVAVMDGPGDGFQGRREVAAQVVSGLAQSGHGLITFPRGFNTAQRLAAQAGVTGGLVYRQIDAEGQDVRAVKRFLDQAAFRARQERAVILVGRTRPETLQALEEWAQGNRAASVTLAPVSAVLLAGTGPS